MTAGYSTGENAAMAVVFRRKAARKRILENLIVDPTQDNRGQGHLLSRLPERRRVQCRRVPERDVASYFVHQCIGTIMAGIRIAGLCLTEPQMTLSAFRSWFHKTIVGGIPIGGRGKEGFFGFALEDLDLQRRTHRIIGTIFQNSYDQNMIHGGTTGGIAKWHWGQIGRPDVHWFLKADGDDI